MSEIDLEYTVTTKPLPPAIHFGKFASWRRASTT